MNFQPLHRGLSAFKLAVCARCADRRPSWSRQGEVIHLARNLFPRTQTAKVAVPPHLAHYAASRPRDAAGRGGFMDADLTWLSSDISFKPIGEERFLPLRPSARAEMSD